MSQHPLYRNDWSHHNQRLLFLTEQSKAIKDGRSLEICLGFVHHLQSKEENFGENFHNAPKPTRESLFNGNEKNIVRDWRLPEFIAPLRKEQWKWHPKRHLTKTKENIAVFRSVLEESIEEGNKYLKTKPHADLTQALQAFSSGAGAIDIMGGDKKTVELTSILHSQRALLFEMLGQHEAAYMDALYACHIDNKNDQAWCRAIKNLSLIPKIAMFSGKEEEFKSIYLNLWIPDFKKHCPGSLQTTPHALEMYEYVQKRKDQYQDPLKNVIEYRTLENRKNEVKELIKELTKFELYPSYEPVKQLYKEFKKYIDTGERAIIDIPCPNMIFRGVCVNMRMKGVLANTVNEKVMMKMEKLKM